MNEEAIVEKLKENLPQANEFTPAIQATPDTNVGQATIAPIYELDEITQYKLHDYFGERYKPNDEIARQQIEYIYDKVSKLVDPPEYGFIVAKIRDLERIIGTANEDKRIYRLYQWLKLDSMRKTLDAEIGALSGN